MTATGNGAHPLLCASCLFVFIDSYAETDSNTEIKKREKSSSLTEFNKSTLMDQWRQDLDYRCPTDFGEVYGKMNGTVSCLLSNQKVLPVVYSVLLVGIHTRCGNSFIHSLGLLHHNLNCKEHYKKTASFKYVPL